MTLRHLLDDDWLTGPQGLRLSAVRRRAYVHDREIALTKTTFDLLELLLRRRGAVVTIDELVREVWGYENSSRPGFARTAVYRLRKELKESGVGNFIEAVRGVGFRVPDDFPEPQPLARSDDNNIELAMRAASTAIFPMTTDRRIVWANPAAEELSGYSLEELRARPNSSFLTPPELRSTVLDMFRVVMSGKPWFLSNAPLERRDGSPIPVDGSWKAIRNERGEITHTIFEALPTARGRLGGNASPTAMDSAKSGIAS